MLLYSAVEQLCAALSCREMGGAMCPIRRPCHNVYYQHHKYIPQGCQQPSVLAMVYDTKIKEDMNLLLLPHLHHSIKNFQLHPRKYQHKERYQNVIINTLQNEGAQASKRVNIIIANQGSLGECSSRKISILRECVWGLLIVVNIMSFRVYKNGLEMSMGGKAICPRQWFPKL